MRHDRADPLLSRAVRVRDGSALSCAFSLFQGGDAGRRRRDVPTCHAYSITITLNRESVG
jgi:hypothetical protein